MKISEAMGADQEAPDQEEQGEENILDEINKKLDLIMQKMGIAEE